MQMFDTFSTRHLSLPVVFITALVTPFVVAESGHGAHVHGLAELTMALEGNVLEIELTSPAASILGFEHRAESEAQVAAVHNAQRHLGNASTLFSFEGTECTQRKATVGIDHMLKAEEEDHQGKHEHEFHSDISAHYIYHCADGEALRSLRIGAEGLPFGIEELNVMWITSHGQGAAVLTKYNHSVELE